MLAGAAVSFLNKRKSVLSNPQSSPKTTSAKTLDEAFSAKSIDEGDEDQEDEEQKGEFEGAKPAELPPAAEDPVAPQPPPPPPDVPMFEFTLPTPFTDALVLTGEVRKHTDIFLSNSFFSPSLTVSDLSLLS